MITLNTPLTKEVVTLDEHVEDSGLHKDTNSCIKFDYELNDKASRVKILKAADRPPMRWIKIPPLVTLFSVLVLGSICSILDRCTG